MQPTDPQPPNRLTEAEINLKQTEQQLQQHLQAAKNFVQFAQEKTNLYNQEIRQLELRVARLQGNVEGLKPTEPPPAESLPPQAD